MKKTLTAILLSISFSASAASYVSVDAESVKGLKGGASSTAQYFRAGTELAGLQWDLQNRTARFERGAGLINSTELTTGKKLGLVTPFAGAGYDAGFNGKGQFSYGLIGAKAGLQVGPGYALAGLKTRVGSTESTPTKQTVVFSTYSIPVTKTVSFNLNASKSFQTIKENAFGVGLGFSF